VDRRALALLAGLGLALAACGGPVSASRADPRVVQHDLARSAVTTGDPSWAARSPTLAETLTAVETLGARATALDADLDRRARRGAEAPRVAVMVGLLAGMPRAANTVG
jgi:hypothetical protein